MPSSHFLYVIGPAKHDLGPCKLGISCQPFERLRQIQTGHPEMLKVYHQEPASSENVKALEKLLHRDINYLRTRGEWFNVTVEEAIAHVRFTLIHYDAIENLSDKVRKKRV